MTDRERLELFKAALAVAVVDGDLTRAEMGVVMGLAARVGIGQASLKAMTEAARRDRHFADGVFLRSPDTALKAMELLVAEARIDSEISDEERELLVRLAGRLGIEGEAFQTAYRAGLARADQVRDSRKGS